MLIFQASKIINISCYFFVKTFEKASIFSITIKIRNNLTDFWHSFEQIKLYGVVNIKKQQIHGKSNILEIILKISTQYDIVSENCITFVPFNSKYLLFNNEDFICIFLFLLLL